jgi:hypothetical protein
VREGEDANRTREAGNRDEVEGVVAITLDAFRGGAVGFIDWLGLVTLSKRTGSSLPHYCQPFLPPPTLSGANNPYSFLKR